MKKMTRTFSAYVWPGGAVPPPATERGAPAGAPPVRQDDPPDISARTRRPQAAQPLRPTG